MKPETLIYDKVRRIIPKESSKTVFFAAVTETSYEVFFYAYIDGNPVQCFELAEQGMLDENELDIVFAYIVDIIKESEFYQNDKNNIATITVDKSGVKMDMEYIKKDARIYGVKKKWKMNILSKKINEENCI